MSVSSVALLIVGREFLIGKAEESNAAYAAKTLYKVGVKLEKIVIIPDDLEVIANNVKELSEQFDFLLTVGGIGPTHGDLTVAAVAKALNQEVIRHPYLESVVSRHFQGVNLTAAQGRLAEVPSEAQLLVLNGDDEDNQTGDTPDCFPQVYVKNIYMMPGLPKAFRHHLDNLLSVFKGQPLHHLGISVKGIESKLTASLNRAVKAYPGVKFSSYPSYDKDNPTSFIVELTLEADNDEILQQAKQYLLKVIPNDMEIINS